MIYCEKKQERMKIMEENKEFKELNEEELTSVAGGNIASSKTYEQLGFKINNISRDQKLCYHPIIVTSFNRCKLDGNIHSACFKCWWCKRRGIVQYCGSRSREVDTNPR